PVLPHVPLAPDGTWLPRGINNLQRSRDAHAKILFVT
nr:hypothetical protein [Chlamydiota bacterium]